MNTIENNKLLAEFLNCKQDGNGQYLIPNWGWDKVENLKFHNDWNWLMEVVKKCKTIQLSNKNKIADIYDALHNTNIDSVYKACVEFIKWYNENK